MFRKLLTFITPFAFYELVARSISKSRVSVIRNKDLSTAKTWRCLNLYGGLYLCYDEELDNRLKQEAAKKREEKSQKIRKKIEYKLYNKISKNDRLKIAEGLIEDYSPSEIPDLIDNLKNRYNSWLDN